MSAPMIAGSIRPVLRARQRIGKYRIEERLGQGGFATVYRAMDTIEGHRVAIKIPHAEYVDDAVLSDFRTEIRTAVKLDHPHILRLKDASIIDDRLVIAFPLGERTLDERLSKRMALATSLELADQMLDAVAYAHRMRIIHCDIKPENFILFPNNQLKLTDFGIAKVAQKTVRGSGTGTIGFMAPEQAMGKPSYRSDVFSAGLILYRMLSGVWPEYPFDWPLAGHKKLKGRVHADMVTFLMRALEPNPRHRFRDADQMRNAYRRIQGRATKTSRRRKAA